MTTAQNTQLWQDIGAIADDETLMKRLSRYVAKLAREKKDSTLMTEDEFFAKLSRAEEQLQRGEGTEMQPGENLSSFLSRNGYGI